MSSKTPLCGIMVELQRRAFLLVLCLALCPAAWAQQPQVPSLQAVSLQRGNAITRSSTVRSEGASSYVANSKASSRMAAVKVTLRSFSKPTTPYEVQCFFCAKDYSKARYVFDAKKVLSSAAFDEITITSRELDGGTQKFEQTTTPQAINGQTGPGALVDPNRLLIQQLTTTRVGSTLEGWVVRVISGGKVVRTEASLQELKVFAERESAMLDEIATKVAVSP